jgi:hypothetical protein
VKRGAISSMRYTRRPRDSDKSETGPGESGGDEKEEKSGGGVSALAAIRVPAIVVSDGLQHAQFVAGVQVPRWVIHLEPFAPNNSAQTHHILPGSLTTEGEKGGGRGGGVEKGGNALNQLQWPHTTSATLPVSRASAT